MDRALIITAKLAIPLTEIDLRFARGGGPGGQNVNKVETKVEALFDVLGSPRLTAAQRALALERLGSRIDNEGILHVVASESRSQWKNRQEVLRRLAELLRDAIRPPVKRVKTKTPRAAKQRRLDDKKKRGERKRSRRVDL